MDISTISIAISIFTVTLTFANFFTNRSSSNLKDGERWGALNNELQHMGGDIKEIKENVRQTKEQSEKSLEEIKKHFKINVNKVHARIDQHLREQHNMDVPER